MKIVYEDSYGDEFEEIIIAEQEKDGYSIFYTNENLFIENGRNTGLYRVPQYYIEEFLKSGYSMMDEYSDFIEYYQITGHEPTINTNLGIRFIITNSIEYNGSTFDNIWILSDKAYRKNFLYFWKDNLWWKVVIWAMSKKWFYKQRFIQSATTIEVNVRL